MAFYYFNINKSESGIYRSWKLDAEMKRSLGRSLRKEGNYVAVTTRESVCQMEISADKGKALSCFIALNGAFNGAKARVEKGEQVTDICLTAEGTTDPGLAINLLEAIKGKLLFSVKGSVSGGYRNGRFTVLFIKNGVDGDIILSEEDIDPSSMLSVSLQIPNGTEKINFMVVGPKSVANLCINNVRIL